MAFLLLAGRLKDKFISLHVMDAGFHFTFVRSVLGLFGCLFCHTQLAATHTHTYVGV